MQLCEMGLYVWLPSDVVHTLYIYDVYRIVRDRQQILNRKIGNEQKKSRRAKERQRASKEEREREIFLKIAHIKTQEKKILL